MLEELTIRDYAIIDRLQLRFGSGLNLLTGETGAGKSILIGALGFLLGAKAETGQIRAGSEECMVSGMFDLSGNPAARQWLADHGLQAEDGTAIIRRSLRNTGRGSIYLQNSPILRQDLLDFASNLVEIHGQRDGMALLRSDRQRMLLDRHAGIQADLAAYGEQYGQLCAKRRLLASLTDSGQANEREMELLRFAVDEIGQAELQPGEEEGLQEEEQRLAQHEKLFAAVAASHEALSGEGGVLSILRRMRSQLETARTIDSRLSEAARITEAAYFDLEDTASSLGSYADSESFDPARLEGIETRLAAIQKLKRKYGACIADILAYRDEAVERLAAFENRDEEIAGLEKAIAQLEQAVYAMAERLSQRRAAASASLAEGIQAVLADLGMPHARFKIDLPRKPLENGKVVLGPYGLDEPLYLVSANKGEPLRPLTAVASGGELSRIMLAIKTMFIRSDDMPTMVFDEIDAGIGGEVALSLGRHLAEIAEKRQILCITHLASIAVRADNHYKVEKTLAGERTVTRLVPLEPAERVQEIARMLSGDANSASSVNHARDLLAKYRRQRGS